MNKNLILLESEFVTAFEKMQQIAQNLNTNIATLPDVIKMRLAQNIKLSLVWNKPFTTITTVYFGTLNGNRTIIVAHHSGPLSNVSRLKEFLSMNSAKLVFGRRDSGFAGAPKITQKEFDALAKGDYGKVCIIPFDQSLETSLRSSIGINDSINNVFIKALLGINSESIIQQYYKIIKNYTVNLEESTLKDCLFSINLQDSYGFNYFDIDEWPEQPAAFFIELGIPDSQFSYYTPIKFVNDPFTVNLGVITNFSEALCEI